MKLLICFFVTVASSLCFAYNIGEHIIVRGPNSGKTLRQVVEAYRVPGQQIKIAEDAIDDTFSFFDRYYGADRIFSQTSVWPVAQTNYEYISLTPAWKRGPAIWNADYVIILDFSQPSSKKRLHLINIVTGEIESIRTGHGIGSDCAGRACRFEGFTAEDSNRSPLGFFVTGQSYNSREKGPAIIMIGLEGRSSTFEGNDPPTTIVIHGAPYVTESNVGRSNGCVAISHNNMNSMYERMDDGVLFYFYHPSLGNRRIQVSGLTSPPPALTASAPAGSQSDDNADEASSSSDSDN